MAEIQNNELSGSESIRSYEVSRKRVLKHRYLPGQQFDQWIHDFGVYAMLFLIIVTLLQPAVVWVAAIVFLIIYLLTLSTKKYDQWAVCKPIYLKEKEEVEFKTHKPAQSRKLSKNKADGLVYFGNDTATRHKAIWLNREMLVTHMALFGSTGSGKTEFLLGLMYQLALLGSGFVYVDGKASIQTFSKLYSALKSLGLQDNLLVINFFTGDKKSTDKDKISNTFNPFAYGSSDTLMEILSGLMGSQGGDFSMWRGRAEALGRCLLRALCELRDQGVFTLSVETIREHMTLESLLALQSHPDLSPLAKDSIQYYLNDLPGWSVLNAASTPEQQSKAELEVNKQHNYLTMQFTAVLELLSGTYGHITQVEYSDVDFIDVIAHRRFLYIMLPSLEKSPESLKNLGKLIVTSIRNALSRLLGIDSLTGSKESLLDNQSFKADIPFAMIFDEYGSYCLEGFADVAAQARELNIMQIFAAQDYESFEAGSSIEAGRIMSNTGIKVFMKIESHKTAQLAIDRASGAYAYMNENIKPSEEGNDSRLKEINRLRFDDLFEQKPGEAKMIYSNKLWHLQGFYGDFKPVDQYKLNTFMTLNLP